MFLQRFNRASSLSGSSFKNLTASTSTLNTTRILLCKVGNWSKHINCRTLYIDLAYCWVIEISTFLKKTCCLQNTAQNNYALFMYWTKVQHRYGVVITEQDQCSPIKSKWVLRGLFFIAPQALEHALLRVRVHSVCVCVCVCVCLFTTHCCVCALGWVKMQSTNFEYGSPYLTIHHN